MHVRHNAEDELIAVDQPVGELAASLFGGIALIWIDLSVWNVGTTAIGAPALLGAVLILGGWWTFPLQTMRFDARDGLLEWTSWRLFWRWRGHYQIEDIDGLVWQPGYNIEDRRTEYRLRLRLKSDEIAMHRTPRLQSYEQTCYTINKWLKRTKRSLWEIQFADSLETASD
ncbi:MAG: hypothetical protein AAF334_03695 [Pseudomonadota bacterium]